MPILGPELNLYPSQLFASSEAGRPWRVARVRSRQEKELARRLALQEVGFYLPLERKQVRRAGRSFVSHLPLFPGYLFFRGSLEERAAALRTDRIVDVIEVRDQALLERELRRLRQLEESGAPLVPHPYLGPGDEVEVVDGPFRGWTGTVLREKGRLRLVVSVSFLRQSVAAELGREDLVPRSDRQRGRGALALAAS